MSHAKLSVPHLNPEESRPGHLNICPPSEPTPFLLKSPYNPAGDQPQAIEAITKAFQNGEKFQVLLGVTGSGKTGGQMVIFVKKISIQGGNADWIKLRLLVNQHLLYYP